jgi:hypothetical protein
MIISAWAAHVLAVRQGVTSGSTSRIIVPTDSSLALVHRSAGPVTHTWSAVTGSSPLAARSKARHAVRYARCGALQSFAAPAQVLAARP